MGLSMSIAHRRRAAYSVSLSLIVLVIALTSPLATANETPSRIVSPARLTQYGQTLSQGNLLSLNSDDLVATITTLATLKQTIPNKNALCAKFKQMLNEPEDIAQVHAALVGGRAAGCDASTITPTNAATKIIAEAIRSEVLERVYKGVIALFATPSLSVHDFDLADGASLAADLFVSDGTARISAPSVTSTVRHAGMAYSVLGLVFKGVRDLEDLLKEKIRASLKRVASTAQQASKPGVVVRDIADFLEGISLLHDAVEEQLLVPSATMATLADAVVSQQATTVRRAISGVVSASFFLSNNGISVPLALTLDQSVIPHSSGSLSITITDVLGRPFPPSSASVSAELSTISSLDGSVLDKSVPLSSSSSKPDQGKFTYTSSKLASAPASPYLLAFQVTVTPRGSSSSLPIASVPAVVRRIIKSGAILSATTTLYLADDASGQRASATIEQSSTSSAPTTPVKLNINAAKYLRVQALVSYTPGVTRALPLLRFVRVNSNSPLAEGRAAVFPFRTSTAVSTSQSKHGVAIPTATSEVRSSFSGDGDYDVYLDVTAKSTHLSPDGSSSTPISYKVARVTIEGLDPFTPPTDPGALPTTKFHTFAPPERLPFSLISIVFSSLVFLPLFAVVSYAFRLRSLALTDLSASESFIALLFIGSLVAGVLTHIIYWFYLNIFQAFLLTAAVCIPMLVIGHRALSAIHARNGLAIEKVSIDRASDIDAVINKKIN